MTIETLLFDVDGTLADTEETHRQAFNAAFLEFRLPYAWSADTCRIATCACSARCSPRA